MPHLNRDADETEKRENMKFALTAFAAATLISVSATAGVLATVNGKAITTEEVNAVLMEGTQGRFQTLPKEKQDELLKRVVDGMITQELVYSDAQKTGVLDTQEFKDERKVLLKRIDKQLAAKIWEKQQFDKIVVPEKELKAYYDSHTEEFVEKEKVHARHILVKTDTEANAIEKKLQGLKGDALKTKFIELAKSESTGPSGPKGGDLGSFAQGQMVPEFNEAVFKMKVGTITDTPVKTQFGYHIIYLEEKKEGKKMSYDEVKTFIEQRIKTEEFRTLIEEKMKTLKDAAKITFGQ